MRKTGALLKKYNLNNLEKSIRRTCNFPKNLELFTRKQNLLNPRSRYPERFRFNPMNSVHQLFKRNRKIGVYDYFVEKMSVQKFDPCSAMQNFTKFFVLQSNRVSEYSLYNIARIILNKKNDWFTVKPRELLSSKVDLALASFLVSFNISNLGGFIYITYGFVCGVRSIFNAW